jgi:two-component system, LuxR family, sensor kinase FixL
LFGTNCAQALLAAGLVHRWSDEPARFDSLRRVLVFLAGAVLAAPLVTSFADAAAVHGLRGEAFGAVFIRRLFSNFLGQLVLVPSVVVLVRLAGRWPRGLPRRRLAELAAIAVAHLTVGGLVLSAYHGAFDLPGGPFAALPLLMPLLFLAAIRFGPGGASLSLLATALLATCIAVSGASASGVVLAEERVLALQVFLIVAGAPLLCLSALMEERGRAAATLRRRLRFEELVSQISGAFVHVPSGRMREAFAEALSLLGAFLQLDGAAVWSAEDAPPAAAGAAGPLARQQPIAWLDRNGAAASTLAEGEWMERIDPPAEQSLPLIAGDRVLGRLVLVPAEGRAWSESELEGARLVADVFASALARLKAEALANRMRDELAHCLRLSTVGELATSIAHELNQPLTAILANAQAAQNLLPDARRDGAAAEIHEMLDDIISEDRRAGEVIRGVRVLLRKGERDTAELDIDILVREVLKLVANDAMIRDVDLQPELGLPRALVRGDRVQLQQVLLNLLLNALEAIPDGPGARVVSVRTAYGPDGTVVVSVTDTGRGLPAGSEAAVFEPFYTTKTDGLGMGLSIARSIVEAHGGTISATGSPDGARVAFTLPRVGSRPS